MKFSDILSSLPSIDHLTSIELFDGKTHHAQIENKPGSAGSARVYYALQQEFGEIDRIAASKGLQMFAEHTIDAKNLPGKHPNIDRLFKVCDGDIGALTILLHTSQR
jgi:hypothetical protein